MSTYRIKHQPRPRWQVSRKHVDTIVHDVELCDVLTVNIERLDLDAIRKAKRDARAQGWTYNRTLRHPDRLSFYARLSTR